MFTALRTYYRGDKRGQGNNDWEVAIKQHSQSYVIRGQLVRAYAHGASSGASLSSKHLIEEWGNVHKAPKMEDPLSRMHVHECIMIYKNQEINDIHKVQQLLGNNVGFLQDFGGNR